MCWPDFKVFWYYWTDMKVTRLRISGRWLRARGKGINPYFWLYLPKSLKFRNTGSLVNLTVTRKNGAHKLFQCFLVNYNLFHTERTEQISYRCKHQIQVNYAVGRCLINIFSSLYFFVNISKSLCLGIKFVYIMREYDLRILLAIFWYLLVQEDSKQI